MSIELIRLDDRLVHGQVVAGWVKTLRSTSIVVVDDEVAGDPFQESLMRMAVPESIDVEVFPVDKCNGLYRQLEESPRRAIVLFSHVIDLFTLFSRDEFPVRVLNIGGISFSEGRKQLAESLFLSEAETQMLADMANAGVEVELQPTPFDKVIDFHELLKIRDARRLAKGW